MLCDPFDHGFDIESLTGSNDKRRTKVHKILPGYGKLSFIKIKTLFLRKRATLPSAFSGWAFSHNVA